MNMLQHNYCTWQVTTHLQHRSARGDYENPSSTYLLYCYSYKYLLLCQIHTISSSCRHPSVARHLNVLPLDSIFDTKGKLRLPHIIQSIISNTFGQDDYEVVKKLRISLRLP
eukprot:scpid103917/ scgid10142/ 